MNVCSKCQGKKHILVIKEDFMGIKREFYKPCSCLIEDKFRTKLGSRIFDQSRVVKKSKLINKLETNLFIHGREAKFLPHLKHVLIRQGLDFGFELMDDSRYLRIYLGDDPEIKDINSWQKPFMVLFMGTVGYKNRALPGMLNELLRMRLLRGVITWVHYPDRFWGNGCLEYSDDLNEVLESFEYIDMRSKETRSQKSADMPGGQVNDRLLNGFNTG